MTLYYHSPKAYRYLMKILCLPSQSSIRKLAGKIRYRVGVQEHVLKELQRMANRNCEFQDCSLVIDAMAIKSSVRYDKHEERFMGFVDYGFGNVGTNEAKGVLVAMIVGLKNNWKVCTTKYVSFHTLNYS